MRNFENILAIFLIAFIVVGLISYFTLSHIDSMRKLNQNANNAFSYYEPLTFLDFTDEKVLEEERQNRIFYENLERSPKPVLDLKNIESDKRRRLRSLATSNVFEKVGFIDPIFDDYSLFKSWIFKNIRIHSSNIILYPYAFDYKFEDGNTKHFSQGAIISINPSELDAYNIGLKSNGTLSIQKARAIFDADIAVLSIIGYYPDYGNIDYFKERIDWCTYLSAMEKGYCYSCLDDFLVAKRRDGLAYITLLNDTEINNDALMDQGFPRFGILIIPDFMMGTYDRIKSRLKDSMSKIVEFYEKGGVIICNGKSGILLEDMGLVEKGTYDRTKLLEANNQYFRIKTKGCENTYNKTYNKNEDDFEKQVLCLSINETNNACLQSAYLTKKLDPNFKKLIDLDKDSEDLKIVNVNTNTLSELTDEEKAILPMISVKKNAQNGKIFLNNYNPICLNNYGVTRYIVYNLIYLALSKELYMNSKVHLFMNSTENLDLPIPAGETGVNLAVNTLIHNLNDQDYSDCQLYLFIPEFFGWTDFPDNCKLINDLSNIPNEVQVKRTIKTSTNYVLCNLGKITAYEKRNYKVTISIENYKATQAKYNILILESISYFLDNNKKVFSMANYVKVNSESAASLRVSANLDPSSSYPVLGTGQYLDNVIRVENKEQSKANDIEYTGIIPIITPLLEADDQRQTQWNIKIYADYYNKYNFEVPFESDNASDYIYIASLQGKGAYMVSEWDGPVSPFKELIDKEQAEEYRDALQKELDLIGINQGLITVNQNNEIIKQINYRKSDRFYKLASQRLMIFIDDSTPNGAKTLYGDNIPNDIKDPILGDRVKRSFIYMRNDIYFYKNENFCNPPSINENMLFSVDKLIPYKNKDCVTQRGLAKSEIHQKGFFDRKGDHKDTIHEPNVYTNAMFKYCNLNIIDPTSEKDIQSYFGSLENFRPVHYIVPNVEKHIISSEQIYDFVSDNGYFGHHKDYPYIKFIYVHSLNFVIQSNNCLYGGRITVDLGSYKINSIEDVSFAPDQIAVFKKLYIDNKIIIYFRRGLMSNEQFGKKLNLALYLENISPETKNEIQLKINIEEMKYDVSFYPEFERYYPVSNNTETFKYISAFSYPALEIKSTLNKTLNGYEMIEPFSRYGIYNQELGHRFVYARLEAHNEKTPGLVGNGPGFSSIINLGTSSIPFIEYMTVGKGQLIPGSPTTSRITWKDIWGRIWHQPIRSLFCDYVPIPPPLKNFIMTSTYKIIRDNKIIYEWPSDENVKILLKIKLLNNYPKYFEITRCKENKIRFIPQNLFEQHSRVFTSQCYAEIKDSELPNSNNIFLREGGYASYGSCFTGEGSIVGGKKVEGEFLEKIKQATLCADYINEQSIAECAEKLKDITTLHKIDSSFDNTKIWNYSPQVESYYPKGYIEKDMWDLTHIDYDDNNMDKAYKYHNDNQLPNYDNGYIKPLNSIAVPIYKGLGYSISYNKNNQMNYHNMIRKGWWPDNLQNRDDTLLGGQNTCNKISVNKVSSIENWIDSKDLEGINETTTQYAKDIIKERNKNIYVCLFGRKRPAFPKNNQKKFYSSNIQINNIVPILVDLEANDERLTNYPCGNVQYDDAAKISELDGNYLETPTSKDYLYFAANLRGHAKESFNILLDLKFFNQIKYEGMTKINEGGRFVYWNPVNGPNSFLTVDNPTSIIQAKRNDIELANFVLPSYVYTFDSVAYYLLSIKDENKINKIWPYNEFYDNSYGFEDVSIQVYVGGVNKTKAVIQPGDTTYARIIFYNNCGYDWNFIVDAIDFEEKELKPFNAYDLLSNLVHAVRKPTSYNFLKYIIDEDLKKYIIVEPSDHNIDVPPEFFDFENINVATIRDGFKGEYALKITISEDFPNEYRGKPIEIKIELNTTYFDHFPGTSTDPIKDYHPYTIKIPSVYIAVPFLDGEFAGKVLYTSAQASNLQLSFGTFIDFHLLDIKYSDKMAFEKMKVTTDQKEIEKIWLEIQNITKPKVEVKDQSKYNITFEGNYALFPAKVKGNQPDIAEIYVVMKFYINQIQRGTRFPFYNNMIKYTDWIEKEKTAKANNARLDAVGAWIDLSYDSITLVDQLPNGTFVQSSNQEMTHDKGGYVQLLVKLSNIGNWDATETSYTIALESIFDYYSHGLGINKADQIKDIKTNTTNITFNLNAPITSSNSRSFYIYLKYSPIIDSYNYLSNEQITELPKTALVSKESFSKMIANGKKDKVTQYLRKSLSFKYQTVKEGAKVYIDLVVSGRRSNPTIEIRPKVKLEDENNNNIKIDIIKTDLTEYTEKTDIAIPDKYILQDHSIIESIEDHPIEKELSNENHVILYTIYLKKETYKLTSNKISYIQNDIGLSTTEVVLIIISIVFYATSVFFIWLGIRNLKKRNADSLESQVKSEKIDRLLV